MTSRKRISIALAGLILLVVLGWFVREFTGTGNEQPAPRGLAVFQTVQASTVSPGAPCMPFPPYTVVDVNG